MEAGAAARHLCREKPRHRGATQLGRHWEGLLLRGLGHPGKGQAPGTAPLGHEDSRLGSTRTRTGSPQQHPFTRRDCHITGGQGCPGPCLHSVWLQLHSALRCDPPVPILEAAGVYQQDPTYSVPLHASGPHTALRIWGLQRCPAPVLERTRDFLHIERALCRGKLHIELRNDFHL